MSCPMYREKIFGGISGPIQPLSHRKRNDLIGFTMYNELGNGYTLNFSQVVVVVGQEGRQKLKKEHVFRHILGRGKSALDYE